MARREEMIPPRKFLRICRGSLRRAKLADSSGVELTGAGLLTRTLILRRLLRREVLGSNADEKHVGLLIPPSVGAAVTNAAVSLDGRIAVNLNYTVSSDVINACISQCRIRHVLTSRRAMEKLDLKIDAELVYLEDFKEKVTLADKLAAAAQTWLLPAAALERWLRLTRIDPRDVLTVIFTSGSTGLPKGVMLTHHNVGTNIEGFNAIINLQRRDVLVGILPLFHSFGFTVTLWTVLTLQPKGIYHYSPLEARQIGKLCRQHGATILIATPTFLRSYVRRCQREDFAAMEVVITGAEKLPPELAGLFEQKFGVRPVEGYGTTELSPVVGANIPPSRVTGTTPHGCREGTIGRPLPGVLAKTVDLDTGEDLGAGRSGIGELVSFDAEGTGRERAAEVLDLDGGRYLRSPKNYLDRNSALAFAACELAVRESGLVFPGEEARRGICLGSAGGNGDSLAAFRRQLAAKGARLASPFLFPHTYMNASAGLLSIEYGLGGEHWCFCSGGAAGLEAVGHAAECVARGRAEVMIAGGVEGLSETVFRAALGRGWLSPIDGGVERCAPFAAGRNGTVLGEGAGLFVLEGEAQARARGARILGRLCGWGASSSARGAMLAALGGSGGGGVDAVFAAGSGRVAEDAEEAAAICEVCGPGGAPVVAVKGLVGETLGAGGPLNLAAALVAMESGTLAPAGHGLGCGFAGIDLVVSPRKAEVRSALVNACAGDGGEWVAAYVINADCGMRSAD